MKARTSDFKNLISVVKETKTKITYGSVELGDEQLNSIQPHYEGAILKSTMKQLDLDSNVEIPKDTIINLQFGVKVREASGNDDGYDYINYGNYIVKEIEKQEDTNSYLIKCYDKMLYSMVEYESLGITYPITIRDYINALCNQIGLTFKNANDYFTNYDKTIDKELYLDDSGNSLNYTFRDVLDELAQVTASTICINEEDDELEIRYITNAGETTTNTSGTNLSITSEDSQVNNIQLLGNTTQNTTTGKSLLNPNRIEQTTSHGITVSYDANTQVITFNGTCDTDNTIFYFTNSYLDVPTATSGVTTMAAYYVSGSITNAFSWRMNDTGWTTNKSLDLLNIATVGKKSLTSNATFTLANSSFSFRFNNGSKATNLKLKIMVANNTNTDYEPYTNGISPNPSYPQDIINVTGRQEVKCVGKNLFDGKFRQGSESSTSPTNYCFSNNNLVLSSGTYTFSNTLISGYDYAIFGTTNAFPNSETKTYNSGWKTGNTTFTISQDLYIGILVRKGGSNFTPSDISNYVFQIEKGNTATTYEPYKEETNEVNLGKNLIPQTATGTYEINGVTITTNSDGSITLNGTSNSNYSYVYLTNGYWSSQESTSNGKFEIKANTTYTLKGTGRDDVRFRIRNVTNSTNDSNASSDYTFSYTSKKTINIMLYVYANKTYNNVTLYPQLEESTKSTQYAQYFTPIELCKLGTNKDKIFKNSGKNLFNVNNVESGIFYSTSDGSITSSSVWSQSEYILVNGSEKVSISSAYLTINNSYEISQFNSSKQWLQGEQFSLGTAITYTLNTNAKYIKIGFRNDRDTTNNLQIEKSNTATEYEPYGSGEWYVKKNIGKVVLDGSETWNVWHYDATNVERFYTNLSDDKKANPYGIDRSLSNKFICINSSGDTEHFAWSTSQGIHKQIVIYINKSRLSSVDVASFKTWLGNNKTTVYYILATPTYTKLNDTLQEQLNSIRLLEGTNNVMSSVPIDLTYVSGIDTIDEEFFNEDNVNFGEMYGPVNTIILSRSAESDEIAQSIPSNLSDDEKVAIKIKENQIMNFDNRDEFLYGILTRLYGLRYTQNDYSSKGICYYNICDRYKANIFGKDYYCVMLNDDVTIESGLSENVFTELPEEAKTDYSKTSTSDRIERQTTLIVDKQAGIITSRVKTIEEEIDGENTYQLTQDERYLAGKTYYILQNSQYVVYTNYSVGDVITGDIYEVVNNGILGRIQATEIKQTNQALEISAIDNRFNSDGSVRALSTTDYTFDSNGLKIGKSTDDYNSLQDNTGTYYYEKDTMIGKYTKDGSVQKDFALFGRYYYGIDEHTSVEDFTRDKALFLALLYNDGTEDGIGHFYNGTN